MFDLILFDLDGTLTDPELGITSCVKYALEYFGIKEDSMETLRKFIGPPLVDSFMQYYNMSPENAEIALSKYRERFSVIGLYENEIYDGVLSMLKTLKENGKMLALATSKPIVYAEKILKHFDIFEYFDICVGAELDGTRNDKAEVIKEVLKRAEKAENPIMVGDRKHDIIGAKKNGLKSIGVTYGFAPNGELAEYGADHIVDDIEGLLRLLLS